MKLKKIILICLVLIFASVNVRAQEITMFNGWFGNKYYQDDIKLTGAELTGLMAADPATHQLWKKAKSLETAGWISYVAGFGMLIASLTDSDSYYNSNGNALFWGGLGVELLGTGLLIGSQSNKRKAILKFNQILDEEGIALTMYPKPNGMGMTLWF